MSTGICTVTENVKIGDNLLRYFYSGKSQKNDVMHNLIEKNLSFLLETFSEFNRREGTRLILIVTFRSIV